VIRAASLLAIVALLTAAARSFLPQESALVGTGATLAFGFVLLAALQSGTLFAGLRLPRLTGYLVCGFVAGPSVLNLVTERMLADLKVLNGVAIGLIALSAGGELGLRKLRGRVGVVAATAGVALGVAFVGIAVAVFALSAYLPFMRDLPVAQRAVVALTMGVAFSALSPTVVLALLTETGAAGPVSEASLGIVVLADLAIIVAFAGAKALANATFGGEDAAGLADLLVHIVGSIAAGLVLGVVLLIYLKKINQRVALFIFGACFVCAEAGTRMQLDPLLVCLMAGLFLENLTDVEGSRLVHEIQPAALPVFAVFFAVAGASLHWAVFKSVAVVAVVLAGVRAAALFAGGRLGMALGRVPAAERPFLHYALYSQSGIAIGLAVLIARHFPGWGEGASACMLGGVMVNELVGPVLFKRALVRCGEAGRRAPAAAGH
jgi:NhaP-type Na+/H+ or K+/H+ antiporter